MFGCVIGNRQASDEDHRCYGKHGGYGVGKTVTQGNRSRDRFECKESGCSQRGFRYLVDGPTPGLLCGEAQRVVFQRLVANPDVVFPADAENLLGCTRHDALPLAARAQS